MKNYKYWIALDQVQGIGPVHMKTIYEILRDHGLSVVDIFDLTPEEMKEEFSLNDKVINAVTAARELLPAIERDYFNLLEASIEIIMFFEKQYSGSVLSGPDFHVIRYARVAEPVYSGIHHCFGLFWLFLSCQALNSLVKRALDNRPYVRRTGHGSLTPMNGQ